MMTLVLGAGSESVASIMRARYRNWNFEVLATRTIAPPRYMIARYTVAQLHRRDRVEGAGYEAIDREDH